jgi:putative endonuclease
MDTHNKGNIGEDIAVRFLEESGYEVIARNYRLRDCEIDIVFKDGINVSFGVEEYIVFAEVKYRETHLSGYGFEAVTKHKMRKIFKAAKHFLYTNRYSDDTPVRFDVISIEKEKIRHIINAYEC